MENLVLQPWYHHNLDKYQYGDYPHCHGAMHRQLLQKPHGEFFSTIVIDAEHQL